MRTDTATDSKRITRRNTSSIPRPPSIPDIPSLLSMVPLIEDITDRMGLGLSISDEHEQSVYASRAYTRLIERDSDLLEDVIMLDFEEGKVNLKLLSPYGQGQAISRMAQMAIVGEISVGLAHDFRNMISILSGNLEFLRFQSELLPAENRKEFGDVIEDMQRALDLATELCKRTEVLGSQKADKKAAPEDLRPLLSSAVKMADRQLQNARDEGKRVYIENNVRSPLWANIVFSEVQMAVLNVLFNAIRYSGGSGLDGRIVIDHWRSDDFVQVTIRNNGPPIPEEVRESLFKRPLTTACVHGYGLFTAASGLAAFGGEITFESDSSGTTFILSLPSYRRPGN